MNTEIAQDSSLNPNQKAVLLSIKARREACPEEPVVISATMTDTGLKEPQVRSALRKLVKAGHLVTETVYKLKA